MHNTIQTQAKEMKKKFLTVSIHGAITLLSPKFVDLHRFFTHTHKISWFFSSCFFFIYSYSFDLFPSVTDRYAHSMCMLIFNGHSSAHSCMELKLVNRVCMLTTSRTKKITKHTERFFLLRHCYLSTALIIFG